MTVVTDEEGLWAHRKRLFCVVEIGQPVSRDCLVMVIIVFHNKVASFLCQADCVHFHLGDEVFMQKKIERY
jgi:hypothetical protein